MSKKDDSWEAIFNHKSISKLLETSDSVKISASEIKSITRGEARLLTKYDTRESRPALLRENNITILPKENGVYVLAKGDGYHDLEDITDVASFSSSKLNGVQTFPDDCTSESQTIDMAFASGMLEDFVEETNLVQTMRGRLRTKQFDFLFNNLQLDAAGVQVEVDGGFEGDRVYILEAKMGARDNFIVRQLYYPFRMWKANGVSKEIIPIFLTYTNSEYYFYQYEFEDHGNYDSIKLIKSKKYNLIRNEYYLETEYVLFDEVSINNVEGPLEENIEIPFPQANDIRKVIDTIVAINIGIDNNSKLAEYYEFDIRQSSYYSNAASYLRFIEINNGEYKLTELGKSFINSGPAERRAKVANSLLSTPVLFEMSRRYFKLELIPSLDDIATIIKGHRTDLQSKSTLMRRASTMISWLNWLINNSQRFDNEF